MRDPSPLDAAVADAVTPPPRPFTGVMWMLLSGVLFVGITAIVKHVGQTLPPAQTVFMRYCFGLFFLVPQIPAMARAGLSPPMLWNFGLRGVAHTIGVLFWFTAMARIPMGEVTAMGYLQPVYITLGAALFLHERIAARRIAALGFAILGALIVLRPGFRELSSGHIAMLACSPFFAASYLLAKKMTDLTSPAATLGWMSVTVTIFLAPFAWAVWEPVSWAEMGWTLAMAGIATLGHYSMLRAFRAAPIAMTQPVTFLQLVWSVALGALLYGEAVDFWVVLGGTVILASVVFIAWREARLKRSRAGVPPQPGG